MDQVGVDITLYLTFRLISLADGMYGNFAGRDASRGMAKQSFDLGKFMLA